MKRMFQDDNTTDKVNEDVEAIKQDIKELTDKLKDLKDDSAVLLSEQFSNFASVVNDLTGRGRQGARDGIADLYLSTRHHPLRNLIYAFAAGVIVTLLCRSRK